MPMPCLSNEKSEPSTQNVARMPQCGPCPGVRCRVTVHPSGTRKEDKVENTF